MNQSLNDYLAELESRRYSASRLTHVKRTVEMLMMHLKEAHQIGDCRAVNESHLRAFAVFAATRHRTPKDKLVSPDTLRQWLSCIRCFFAWMNESGRLLRKQKVKSATSALWLGAEGKRLSKQMLAQRIRDYAKDLGLPATVHTFRHSCGTHLLRGGASIRHVQQLLGHRSIATTEIYTHVEIDDLKQAVERVSSLAAEAGTPQSELRNPHSTDS